MFRNQPKHDWTSHTADAWRYLAMAWRAMKEETAEAHAEPHGIEGATWNELMAQQSSGRRRI